MSDHADNRGSGRERAAADLEREATEWFFRRDAGFTTEDGRAFAGWLSADARHCEAFAEIEGTWQSLHEIRDRAATPGESMAVATRFRPRRSGSLIALATAAAIAVGFGGWQLTHPRKQSSEAAPAVARVFAEQVETGPGGLRKMELPDGSMLTLNADSAVDIRLSALERRVHLQRGEVHFAVAKDARRPFVVEVNGVAVKAVGTAFTVRLGAEAVEVLVTEGQVRVDDAARGQSLLAVAAPTASPSAPPAAAAMLVPGEKVVIPVRADAVPMAATVAVLSLREVEAELAWQKRWLEYTDAPLADIVADFNRFNQHQLVITDPVLGRRHFGGTFPAGDYRSLVQVLEATFGVVAERRERETVLRRR